MENRRQFIISSIAMMGTVASGVKALGPGLLSSYSNGVYDLVPGEIVLVRAGMSFNLPARPQDGDAVTLIIRGSSLDTPGIVNYRSSTIMGDKESLELDSMANVKLTFKAATNDWYLA